MSSGPIELSWSETLVKTREIFIFDIFKIELWEAEKEVCLIFSIHNNKENVSSHLRERKYFFLNLQDCQDDLQNLFTEYVEEVYLNKASQIAILEIEMGCCEKILKQKLVFL